MKSALIAFLVLGSMLFAAWSIRSAAVAARESRHDTCVRVAAVDRVLYDEHSIKLARISDYLRKHPRGIPGISRAALLQSIQDEKHIIAQVRPVPCA